MYENYYNNDAPYPEGGYYYKPTKQCYPEYYPTTHVIQPGDWYSKIALKLNQITSDMLEKANPYCPPEKLIPGYVIKIPLDWISL
jgi:LysM repeat protein